VEQQLNPELRGKPIAVIGAGARTVITTSSYDARAFGVRTGMTIYQAKKLCPHIIFVTGNNKKYSEICTMLSEICLRFTPDLEIYSIDEVFLDITGSHHLLNGPEKMAWAIKDTVKKELGLTCTIGIGSNILVAKLASDLAKPDGLRWIKDSMVADVFEKLPVKKLWGIGAHTEEKLRAMGIKTCGELGRASLPLLTKKFGIMGERLKEMGCGRMERPIVAESPEPKSIGHSITVPKDISEREEINSCLLRLSEKVGHRARRYGHKGRKIALTIRYSDFKTFTKQSTLPVSTNDTGEIYRSIISILDKIHLKRPIRLLGVSLSDLAKEEGQLFLFDQAAREKKSALAKAVDSVNEKFGEHTIIPASTIQQDDGPGVISPAWRPTGVRKSD
jgi:DNA polymerase-4